MNEFFKTFFQIGFSVCLIFNSVLILELLTQWIEEKITAKAEMRQSLSLSSIICRRVILLLKSPRIPKEGQSILFTLAPLFAFIFALFFFLFLPFDFVGKFNSELTVLYFLFLPCVGFSAFVIGGWASGSRFSFFGAVRQIAQTISGQLLLAVSILTIAMTAGSGNLNNIIQAQEKIWFIVPHFPMFVLYVLSSAMVLSKAPFAVSKSKTELASGIYAEYTGALYLLFLMAENLFLLFFSALGVVLFLAGDLPFDDTITLPAYSWLLIKIFCFILLFSLLKLSLPSLKTEQMMALTFKRLLPFSLIWLFATGCFLVFVQGGN